MFKRTQARRELAAGLRRGKYALLASVVAACSAGCSYIDAMMSRTAQYPDNRAVLSARDGNVFLARQDLPNYICEPDRVLVCENTGGVKYTCHCALR